MDEESDLGRNGYSHPRNSFLKRSSSKQGGAGQQRGPVFSTGRWRELIAPEEVVYAQNQGSFTSPVRAGSRAGADRPQLLDWSGDCSSISGESGRNRARLAAA